MEKSQTIGVGKNRPASELEKDLESKPTATRAEFIDDPDDGLSEEEKAKIVVSSLTVSTFVTVADLTGAGSQTALAARFDAHPMALSTLPGVLPRSYQYWKCQARRPSGGPAYDQFAV